MSCHTLIIPEKVLISVLVENGNIINNKNRFGPVEHIMI